jgi:hypothetical protein
MDHERPRERQRETPASILQAKDALKCEMLRRLIVAMGCEIVSIHRGPRLDSNVSDQKVGD